MYLNISVNNLSGFLLEHFIFQLSIISKDILPTYTNPVAGFILLLKEQATYITV